MTPTFASESTRLNTIMAAVRERPSETRKLAAAVHAWASWIAHGLRRIGQRLDRKPSAAFEARLAYFDRIASEAGAFSQGDPA